MDRVLISLFQTLRRDGRRTAPPRCRPCRSWAWMPASAGTWTGRPSPRRRRLRASRRRVYRPRPQIRRRRGHSQMDRPQLRAPRLQARWRTDRTAPAPGVCFLTKCAQGAQHAHRTLQWGWRQGQLGGGGGPGGEERGSCCSLSVHARRRGLAPRPLLRLGPRLVLGFVHFQERFGMLVAEFDVMDRQGFSCPVFPESIRQVPTAALGFRV
jgi:hypothetical protein